MNVEYYLIFVILLTYDLYFLLNKIDEKKTYVILGDYEVFKQEGLWMIIVSRLHDISSYPPGD